MQTNVTNIAANSYPSLSIYRVFTLLTVNKVSTNCGLISAFSIDKDSSSTYFCFFNSIRPQPYLILAFSIESNHSSNLLQHFQQKKKPASPYFCFLNNKRPQPLYLPQLYLILAFLFNNKTPQPYLSCTLFQSFQHCKTPVIPYFSISQIKTPAVYTLFLLFEQLQDPSHTFLTSSTLFQHFLQQYKTQASSTLFQHFKQYKTQVIH